MGVIIRSNGVGRTLEEIQWDANYLAEIWAAIEKAAGERKGPFLVYQENNIILRALRDYLRADIGEVVIDNAEVYEQARTHMEHVNPQNRSEEHTSELQSLMRISYAVFCLKKKKTN